MKHANGSGRDAVLFLNAGDRFERLTVIDPDVRKYVPSVPAGIRSAVCACDCGQQVTVPVAQLIKGGTRSCGCLHRDKRADRFRVHGLVDHPLYAIHHAIMQRCYMPQHVHYANYGGRGITVCDRWHDVSLFIEDIERDIGPRPEGQHPSGRAVYTLDRKDNNGHYEPGNVRWATWSEQRRNQRGKVRS
jgi:Staphylococcus phage HNH endonuclease